MTKEELLQRLAEFNTEDLEVALQAASAAKKTRESGESYFMHYFSREKRESFENGKAVIRMPVTSLLMNPKNMLHGGMTAFLCDNAMGMASFLQTGRPGLTLDLGIRYHHPAYAGFVTASGEVVSSGSRINSTACVVRDQDGNLVATATGSFYHRK